MNGSVIALGNGLRAVRKAGAGLCCILVLAAVLMPSAGCSRQQHEHGAREAKAGAPARYHCPMHPAVVAERPGTCPICFMDLEVISESAQAAMKGTVTGRTTVVVDSAMRQKMGLTLGKVERKRVAAELRVAARVVSDETRVHRVTTKVEGWVERLDAGVTGQRVRKGDPLFGLYSPQLVSAQEEYLAAVSAAAKSPVDLAKQVVSAARQRLRLWDISDEQVRALESAGRPERTMTIAAPADGWILEKGVLQGQKVTPGDSLFVIADLAEVWVVMDVYEPDIGLVTNGMPAKVTLLAFPGREFGSAVEFVAPALDPATRTVRVRARLANAELALRPGMLGQAVLSADLGEQATLPVGAVLRTGEHTYVFRDAGEGRLEPIEVKVGRRCGGDLVLSEGLFEGETVVTSANFLIDSESSIRAALESFKAPGSQGGTPAKK